MRLSFIALLFLVATLTRSELSSSRTHILEYDIALNLNVPDSSFSAIETLALHPNGNDTLHLDATNLKIDSIKENETQLSFQETPGTLAIGIPDKHDKLLRLKYFYHAKPSTGLVIHPLEVYTGFNSDSWFVCDHHPGEKARYRLTLSLPAEWNIAASGDLERSDTLPSQQIRYSFYQSIPISAYTFGFAAGLFRLDTERAGTTLLRYLTTSYSAQQVDSIFSDTHNTLAFFDSITGIPYPYPTYAQVLTRDENEQEANRFCMLSSDYGKDILSDRREEWLIIHELCHQWFGNSITCNDWSDFWLNEGLTTFLTACYKDNAFGRDEYDREIYLARMRYNRIRGSAKDLPIVRYDYHQSSEMGGIVTYYKAALVLNYLRSIIGEKAFDTGLKRYVRRYWQKSVTTANFEHEMERASKKNLKWFFDEWVYNADSLNVRASYSVANGKVTINLFQSGSRVYRLPLRIAIVSNGIRKIYALDFNDRTRDFSFPTGDTLNAVRIDDGDKLPISVMFDRPISMLLYQAVNEPDVLGRVEAMNALVANYENYSSTEQEVIAKLLNFQANSSSRLMVQLTKNLKKKIESK